MTLSLSPVFELILSVTCYYYGALFLKRRYDLLTGGYMIISLAALAGMMEMLGIDNFSELHRVATAMSRLAGMLSIALGLVFILARYQPQPWVGVSFVSLASVLSYVLYQHDKMHLEWLCTAAGVVFLIAMIVLTVRLAMTGRRREAMAGLSAVVLFGYIALFHKAMPGGYFLKPVDVVHICLILAYPAVYYAAMGGESN